MSDAPDKNATDWAYVFEAKGIQRYLFDSGKLRDAVGASDLAADIAHKTDGKPEDEGEDLVALVMKARIGGAEITFSRRASGAICAHAKDRATLERFRAAWRLTVMRSRPGLPMVDGLGWGTSWKEARESAYASICAARFNSSELTPPRANPFVELVQQTGRPAFELKTYRSAPDEPGETELVDAVVGAQRERADNENARRDGVARRFLAEPRRDGLPIVFPRNLDPDVKEAPKNPHFPFEPGDTRCAIVHADISGLGQIFKKASEQADCPDDIRKLAEDIEAAMIDAARNAASVFLDESGPHKKFNMVVPPARPLVLGGDDITVLVRADLAIEFARKLLTEIEERSGEIMKARNVGFEYLSACAGVAIFRRGQPFVMAHALAEDLCKFAKAAAKAQECRPYPSALAFHLIASTLQESYGDVRAAEMRAGEDMLTANPYGVGKSGGKIGPSIEQLLALARALDAAHLGRGKLREWRKLRFSDPTSATGLYMRWREVLGDGHVRSVDDAFENLGVSNPASGDLFLAHPAPDVGARVTPLFDALDLIDLNAVPPLREEKAA